MLSRRCLLSGKEIPNTVTIPLLGSFKASNGAEPSINTGCTLTETGLYIPREHVEYKISDLYPKPWTKITMELDLMYTKTSAEHGWFDFFNIDQAWKNAAGVNYNNSPRNKLMLFDCWTIGATPKNTYIHVKVVADFSQGDTTYPHGEVVGLDTESWYMPLSISKPSAIRLGYIYEHDAWQGYARNVKVTFE